MIRVSWRYLSQLTALSAAVLLPVFLLSYVELTQDDCADPHAFRNFKGVGGSRMGQERRDRHTEPVFQWTEGEARIPEGASSPLHYYATRTTDIRHLKRVLERRVLKSFTPESEEIIWHEVDEATLPVRIRTEPDAASGEVRLAAQLFVFGSAPVEDVTRAQLSSLLPQLVRGVRPFTVFVVSGSAPESRGAELQAAALEWLTAAWHHYQAACLL